ncbi:RIB43A-like with coiled-coils protein 2 isoform X4 [Heterocephalus glaber]|uniref:RIB43A-like with coiled-coils protein 2 isoform X4 n=1 Tax=Heterocephalus glaber TaxID=10181 RepID=A0AAX6T098_HETGA|nr:RIB43A-like with coiled-coils protein 2 isoform X4 [Heterocephalus glaber]
MKAVLAKDLEQDAKLAKRTHAELCKQQRVFNARNRIIGGDTQAWDIQVHDQRIKEATEKARHETFAAELRQNDKVICILDDREKRDRKCLCRAISDFQQNCQKPETRQDHYTQTRLNFDETASHLQKLESITRKAVCAAVKEFNRKQAMESAERKRQEKRQEQEDNMAEISSQLRGDLLSENPQQAASSFGPHRVVPDRWKGMSREQLEGVRLAQKQQIQEKLRLQEEARQRDLDWDRRRVQKARVALLGERRQHRQQCEDRRALDRSNLRLAAEQRLQCAGHGWARGRQRSSAPIKRGPGLFPLKRLFIFIYIYI